VEQAAHTEDNLDLLSRPLSVINVGLSNFATELSVNDVEVIDVDWKPPAGGDPELAEILSRLGS